MSDFVWKIDQIDKQFHNATFSTLPQGDHTLPGMRRSTMTVVYVDHLFQLLLLYLSGTYMNHTQAGACDACPPRYYCVNKDRADPCPQGRYCSGSTGFNMTLCPAGTYR